MTCAAALAALSLAPLLAACEGEVASSSPIVPEAERAVRAERARKELAAAVKANDCGASSDAVLALFSGAATAECRRAVGASVDALSAAFDGPAIDRHHAGLPRFGGYLARLGKGDAPTKAQADVLARLAGPCAGLLEQLRLAASVASCSPFVAGRAAPTRAHGREVRALAKAAVGLALRASPNGLEEGAERLLDLAAVGQAMGRGVVPPEAVALGAFVSLRALLGLELVLSLRRLDGAALARISERAGALVAREPALDAMVLAAAHSEGDGFDEAFTSPDLAAIARVVAPAAATALLAEVRKQRLRADQAKVIGQAKTAADVALGRAMVVLGGTLEGKESAPIEAYAAAYEAFARARLTDHVAFALGASIARVHLLAAVRIHAAHLRATPISAPASTAAILALPECTDPNAFGPPIVELVGSSQRWIGLRTSAPIDVLGFTEHRLVYAFEP